MVFIAVHSGAGFYGSQKREKFLDVCSKACEATIKEWKNDSTAIDGVVEAISYLENEIITNAGLGSNLNLGGYVECDACLMDGKDLLFGSVGAIQSIRNPIKVANLILNNQRYKPPLGLIAPNFLAGEGAKKFAISNGLQEFDLISGKSLNIFNKYKRQLDECEPISIDKKHKQYDTVGAVCIDDNNCLASGVSSGGLILKKEGRIGQASIIGSGCWSESNAAVTTSGIGEYLIRTSLARKTIENLIEKNDDDNDTSTIVEKLVKIFHNDFFGSPLMKNIPREDHLAGIMGLSNDSNNIELFWAHSTKSMCIGYMDTAFTSGKSFISDLDCSSKPGLSVIVYL
uniref:Threonine aspartase 1-like isoform X2 n=1 Tax=Dermatophagoides pteronyssinus TaxID=6956 RepID=A0A6P6XVR8_DERPT|nr:threonine aspartase 1-like isoform X2 [Dermatophagoides pteronyssinus]